MGGRLFWWWVLFSAENNSRDFLVYLALVYLFGVGFFVKGVMLMARWFWKKGAEVVEEGAEDEKWVGDYDFAVAQADLALELKRVCLLEYSAECSCRMCGKALGSGNFKYRDGFKASSYYVPFVGSFPLTRCLPRLKWTCPDCGYSFNTKTKSDAVS